MVVFGSGVACCRFHFVGSLPAAIRPTKRAGSQAPCRVPGMEKADGGLPTHQLSPFRSSYPYFLTIFTLCRSREVQCILISPKAALWLG